MNTYHLLHDLAAILLAALGLGYVFHRLKQPVVIGYLLGGLLVGPHVLGVVSDASTIELFAELGVVLLMFALGVEFSFSELAPVRHLALIGGGLQILVTVGLAALASHALGLTTGSGVMLGCIAALSSTVIVLRTLIERGELDSAHGKALLGILIVQDLSVVPMMVVLPNLSTPSGFSLASVAWAFAKAGLFLTGVVLIGTRLLPHLMRPIAGTRSKELLLLAGVFLCFGTAALSHQLGLSLALGAFIAGIMVSESDQSHQILADVLPMRDLFATLFFVSLGMLLDPAFLLEHLGTVLGLTLGLMGFKALLGAGVARGFGYAWRTSLAIGFGLAQVGEFSLVLAQLGERQGLLSAELFSLVLASALFTIILTPPLMQAATPLYLALTRKGMLREPVHARRSPVMTGELTGLVDHVVVCGFGRVGSNLGEVLIHEGIPTLVIELDQNLVNELRARQIPCLYGDPARQEVLRHAHLPLARALIVALPDPTSCQLAVINARALNRSLPILARAHRADDVAELYRLGADEVVQPEFEASLEVIRYTLSRLGYTARDIHRHAQTIRKERYRPFQDGFHPELVPDLLESVDSADTAWFDLAPHSPWVGLSLRQLDLRRQRGINVLALRRNRRVMPNPDANDPLREGDSLLMMGTRHQLQQVLGPAEPEEGV